MRTLFVVPLIFSREDLSKVASALPPDYEEKSKEFWAYVSGKLATQLALVRKVYFDSVTEASDGREHMKKTSPDATDLIQRFASAELVLTEDKGLVAESMSWAKMLESDGSPTTRELLAQTMLDRDKFVAKVISESLKEGETGVLFVGPGRKPTDYLPQDVRTIRVQPFDPMDYLNSWMVTLRLRPTQATPQN